MISQNFEAFTLQIEHIIPRKHHGETILENPVLACFACNNHKGPNLTGIDPDTGKIERLFNPRQDTWSDFFIIEEGKITGISPVGRASEDAFAFNLPNRVELRISIGEE